MTGMFGSLRDHLARGSLTIAGTLAILIAGSIVVVRTVDLQVVQETVREGNPLLLAAAVVVYAASWPVRGRRYDEVLTAMGRRCGVTFLTATVFLSQTANLVVPARAGDGVRAYLLKDHRNVSYPTGTASLAVERVFDLVAITVVGAIASAWLVAGGWTVAVDGSARVAVLAATAVSLVAITCAAGTVGIARSDRQFGPPMRELVDGPRLSRVVDAFLGLGASVRTVASTPRALVSVSAWSLLVWLLDVLTAILVLAALAGGSISGWTLVAVGTLAVSVGNLAKVLPLSQGGIGLYEAAFTGLVVGITPVPAGIALTAAVVDHALKNAVTLVGGAIAGITLGSVPTADPGPVSIAPAEVYDSPEQGD